MVQIGLGLRQRHPVPRDRRDYLATGTPYPLGIRKLVPKSSPQCGQNIPLFLRRICFLVQTSLDRKSTRLNSSHGYISYAVFCLKKKKLIADSPATAHHRWKAEMVNGRQLGDLV